VTYQKKNEVFSIFECGDRSDQLGIKSVRPCYIYSIICESWIGYVQFDSGPKNDTFCILVSGDNTLVMESEMIASTMSRTTSCGNDCLLSMPYTVYLAPDTILGQYTTLPSEISSDRPVYSVHADTCEPLWLTDSINAQQDSRQMTILAIQSSWSDPAAGSHQWSWLEPGLSSSKLVRCGILSHNYSSAISPWAELMNDWIVLIWFMFPISNPIEWRKFMVVWQWSKDY